MRYRNKQDTACVAEKNIFTNCLLAGIDTYFNVDDTVRNNTVTGCEAGVYLNGSGWVAQNNNISVTGQRSPGIRVDIHGPGLTKVENNTVASPGLGLVAATSEPGRGTVIFNNNRVTCSYSNSNFTDYEINGITSIYNTFYGLGIYATGVWPNQMYYSTLAQFQSAVGYENGSVWYSSVAAPIGILTITPDTLTNIPGSVTLSWTTENATVVSIIPIIGVVDSGEREQHCNAHNEYSICTINAERSKRDQLRMLTRDRPPTAKLFSRVRIIRNPFNGSTTIEFVLPNAGYASLKVFDTIGREIATLAEGSY